MEEDIMKHHPSILMTSLVTVIIEMNYYFLYNLKKQIRMILLYLNCNKKANKYVLKSNSHRLQGRHKVRSLSLTLEQQNHSVVDRVFLGGGIIFCFFLS